MDDQGRDGGFRRDEAAPTIGVDGGLRLHRDDILRYQQAMKNRRASLLVIAGNPADIGNTLVFADTVVIGREQANLQLRDGRVSRRHAVVEKLGADYAVRDNQSTNGTLVNGLPVAGLQPLADGDRIHVGDTVVKFTLVDETEASYLRAMDKMVGTDELTGLVAKHRFDAALGEAMRSAAHTGVPLSVLMMDMDRLKQVNDTHGHHMGANTIRQVGGIIAQILTGRGEACRFGGDEFSAFLPGADLAAAWGLAEQIRFAVESRDLGPPGIEIRVSISIGVASMHPSMTEMKQLLDAADQALYRAKTAGRNRVSA